jgi:hypothetical protein
MEFAKSGHTLKLSKGVMPAIFTGFAMYNTVKLPSKVLSTLFDV